MADDKSVFDVSEELGSWVDKRFANAINAATTPENLQKFGAALSSVLQPFIASETDRAIAGAEAAALDVISKVGAVLGVPVETVIGDLTNKVDSTEQELSSNIGGIAQTLGSLAGQVISGVLADLPHLLVKKDPET